MAYHIDENNSDIIFEVNGNRVALKVKSSTNGGGGGSGDIYLITVGDTTTQTDKNTYSALRIMAEIANAKSELKNQLLSKKENDTAQGLIRLLQGIKVGSGDKGITANGVATLLSAIFTNGISSEAFSPGFDGSGMSITKDANGKWHAEFDTLTIRQLFKIFELVYQKATHVGGMQVVSPAGGTLKKVTSYSTYWRCEHDSTDDFLVDDQVLCQTFTGTQKRYWRRITSVGSGYFNLSKSDCETGSGTPSIGDDVAVWGNRTNASRQSLTVINAYGGSYIRMYNGVNSYSLEGKMTSDQSPQNFSVLAEIFKFSSGEKVKDLIDGLTTRMTSAEFNLQSDRIWLGISSYMKSSTRNLVLNSGLFKSAEGWIAIGLGSYSNMFLGDNGALHLNILSTNELYNWGHIAATPTLNIEYGKRYCYKVKVQTNSSQFRLAFRDPAGFFYYEKTFNTKNSGYNEYYYFVDHNNAAALNLTPLIQPNPNNVSMSTTFSVEYMMLAEATIETDWCPAPEDMEAIIRAGVEVVQDEVRLYGRVIVNGTMIANMIEATGLKIKDANGSVTNEIKTDGSMHIASGKTQLNANGSGQFAGGNLYWDEIGRLFKKQREYIVWRNMLTEMGANTILNIFPEQGTFIDIGVPFGQANRRINLPDPTLYPDLEFDIRYDRTEGDTVLRIGCTSHPIKYYSASKNQLFPFALDYFYPNKDGIIKGTILSKDNYWFVSSELYNE